MAPPLTVYGIANCDTVKRARAWLGEHGIDHVFHDFKRAGLPAPQLDEWLSRLGWETLLNRRGTTWRKLAPERQARVVDAASARVLMLEQPSVVKRPVVAWPDGQLSVGFDADDWSRRR